MFQFALPRGFDTSHADQATRFVTSPAVVGFGFVCNSVIAGDDKARFAVGGQFAVGCRGEEGRFAAQ